MAVEHKSSDQESIDEIGELADLCDNMVAAASLPIENTIAVQAMTAKYREVRDRLRAVYVKLSGENPWE